MGSWSAEGEYESFNLVVEWRWPEEPGNSGVLKRKLVNEATGCEVRPGTIGLQSEGEVIHFRTVTLTPMATG